MSTQKSSEVLCPLCAKEFTAQGMGRHLCTCLEKNTSKVAKLNSKKKGFLHLKISTGISADPYFLHIGMDQNASLRVLDAFLRDIWLECCGHLSAFFAGDTFGSEELDMDAKIGHVLVPKQSISYVYDFGSSTELLITARSQHQGRLETKSGIYLLVRNPDPQILCAVCHKNVAEHVDSEDIVFLCNECLEVVEYEQELLLPVVNSPRCGICGYDG